MSASYESSCVSNTSNLCLTTNTNYYDSNRPIVPGVLGLSLLSPDDVQSVSTQELSTPTP